MNDIPHTRDKRRWFYNEVTQAMKAALGDGQTRMSIRSVNTQLAYWILKGPALCTVLCQSHCDSLQCEGHTTLPKEILGVAHVCKSII